MSVGGPYELIKKYKFGYVTKARTGTGSTQFLDKLQLVNTDGVTIGQYSFDYNATALPEQASNAKDFWGYYNGQTGNTNLLPTVVIPGWQPTISDTPTSRTIPGANREPNLTTMKAWVLEKITYPTGGYSTFDFEPHHYLDQLNALAIAGGLRIRQFKNYLPDGTTASVKTYKYGINEAGSGTARFGRNFSQSFKNDYYVTSVNFESKDISVNTGPEYGYRQTTYSSTQSNPLFSAEGSAVTYGRVTEYEDSGTGDIGKTVYDYDDTAFDNTLDINGRQYVENRSWSICWEKRCMEPTGAKNNGRNMCTRPSKRGKHQK